ncbi:TylF/MycF/NovP-related O-methyltransferase [Streptomyces viridochromogenes]|uniref:TylF/MycF/NovP-related O-methyltransferase n=1 Tax=Streptomyces viridochromogenes TaxID=1938 RepID=UPI000A50885B|nr:TylF/MycF/NovP-related O-methyltransferase [Streptomyces viridochromogenes]
MTTTDTAAREEILGDVHQWLLREHGETVDPDRLHHVRAEIERIVREGVPGALVELGCFRGAMTLWIRVLLDTLGDDRPVHVFDSFQGLPDTTEEDEIVMPLGAMAAGMAEVEATFATWGRTPPLMCPGWFEDTLAEGLPESIAFGYLDGDLYTSTQVSLVECVPRLAPGGALILDDYADPEANPRTIVKFPGVKRACDEYFGVPSPVEALPGKGDLAYGRYVRPLR